MLVKSAVVSFLISLCPMAAWAGLTWESTDLKVPAAVGQEQIVVVFPFTNTGDTPVTILKSETSCGCTISELAKDTYAPGESGELKAVFTVGDRIGPQHKTITVSTDDPAKPTVRLVLETDIPTIATFTPKILLWRKFSEPEWKSVIITTQPDTEVTVGKPAEGETLPPNELIAVENSPGQYQLRIHPETTDKRIQSQFPIDIKQPQGLSRTYTIFVLVR